MQLSNTAKQQLQLQFFISYLNTFGDTGNDLLKALDDIASGEVVWFDPETIWGSLILTPSGVSVTFRDKDSYYCYIKNNGSP